MKKSRRTFMSAAAAAVAAPVLASAIRPAARAVEKNSSPGNSGPRFIVAALTMLDSRRQFQDSMNRDYLAYLAEGGVDGVLVLGTTGEFPSFSVAERKRILESFIEHRKDLSIICHVGTPNLPETLELLAHAGQAGATAALVVPPFYYKDPSDSGLADYYEPILKASAIPVMVYNIPQLSGVSITMGLVRRLSGQERMAGMKDSFNPVEAHLPFIREFPGLRFLTGRTPVLSSNLRAGGAGAITGSGSIFPRETKAVFRAFLEGGDLDLAQQRLDSAATALRGFSGIPAMKYALSLKGLAESYPRAPLSELSAVEKQQASEAWARYEGERAHSG